MSLKGVISFDGYIPPTPNGKVQFKTTDLKRSFDTETGDTRSYIIRKDVLEISLSFSLTGTQADALKSALSPNEITVAYRKDGVTASAYMSVTSYSSNCVSVSGKEHYDVSVTLKEVRR